MPRTIKVRIRKGQIEPVEPTELPTEGEGMLTVSESVTTSQNLIEETNRAYATLRSDPKAWEEELRERALWDETLSDGLDAEPSAS